MDLHEKIAHSIDVYTVSTSANINDVAKNVIDTVNNESNHLNIADVALLVDMIIAQSEKTDVLYLKQEYSALINRVKNLNDKTRPAI